MKKGISNLCGSCGTRITSSNRRSTYNSLCTNCKIPHQDLVASLDGDAFVRTAAGDKLWTCQYCGISGSMDEVEALDCGHLYEPCPTCHEHPYCAPDCEAVGMALSAEGVYLAGFLPT